MVVPYADTYVHTPDQIPAGEHWAIIGATNVSIPGDQRSIEAPGHGYPARVESYVTYEVYLTIDKFKEALAAKLLHRDRVRGIHVTGESFALVATIAEK